MNRPSEAADHREEDAMTTKTATRPFGPMSLGLPGGDSGWSCGCDCKAHLDADCQPFNAPAEGKYCPACSAAIELGLIKTLGSLIRDAVEYDGKTRDLENLRKVYALRAAEDVRWMDFMNLWIGQTPSKRCGSAGMQVVEFHTKYATAPEDVPPALEPVAEVAPKPERQPVTEDGMYRNPQTGEIFKVQFNKAQGDGRRLYAKRLVLELGDNAGATKVVTSIPMTEELEPGEEALQVWGATFEYASGAMRWLDGAWKMSLEEAKKFGALYGTCCVCGRTLTDEKSIAAGIGPVCAEKF